MAKRGPKTEAGKAAVRHNAVQHGILSRAPVVPGLESEEDWLTHRVGMLASLEPHGQLEQALAERVILTMWRLRRLEHYEYELIAVQQERVEESLNAHLSHDPFEISKASLEVEDRRSQWQDELRIVEERLALFSSLKRRPDQEPISTQEAVITLHMVCDDLEVEIERIQFRGLPPYEEWRNFTGWTIAHLRKGLQAVAVNVEFNGNLDDVHDVVEFMADYYQSEDSKIREQMDRFELELDRRRRMRLLPSSNDLQVITRYEAHLNRQFYQALHELEAIQARRQGEAAPLARLEVNSTLPG